MGVTNNLREWRKKRGMTQEELSAKADVSRTIISGLENGVISTTTTDTILKLAKALNVSVPKIFFLKEV